MGYDTDGERICGQCGELLSLKDVVCWKCGSRNLKVGPKADLFTDDFAEQAQFNARAQRSGGSLGKVGSGPVIRDCIIQHFTVDHLGGCGEMGVELKFVPGMLKGPMGMKAFIEHMLKFQP